MDDFHVGQKVLCIDDTVLPPGSLFVNPDGETRSSLGDLHGLTKGKIYTVRCFVSGKKFTTIHLDEIKRPLRGNLRGWGFNLHRFKPL